MSKFGRRDVQSCLMCGEGLGHNWMNPTFYRVSLECFILNMQNIHREAGGEAMMGGGVVGAVLNDIMGPGLELATSPGKPIKSFLVCGDCAGVGVDEDDLDPENKPTYIDEMKTKSWDREDGKAENQAG